MFEGGNIRSEASIVTEIWDCHCKWGLIWHLAASEKGKGRKELILSIKEE